MPGLTTTGEQDMLPCVRFVVIQVTYGENVRYIAPSYCKTSMYVIVFVGFKGLNVEVMPSDFDESLQKSSFDCPAEYVKETALQKALCVAQQLKNETVSNVSYLHTRFDV